MHFIDLAFLIIIGGFALFGFWFGFVHTLGSLLGTVFGAFIASRYYEPLADMIIARTGWNANISRLVVFILAFIVINRLIGFIFWLIDRVLSLITRLPFIHSLDRILGMLFGIAEGAITIGLAIFFVERFPLSAPVMQRLADSAIAPQLSHLAHVLWPLLPDAFRLLQSTIDYVRHRFL